ncbi:MAG: DUF89 domain-containing protein [Candidatus Hydrothermarchaeales archaeon]
MNVQEECFACLLSQGRRAIDLAGVEGRERKDMLEKVREFLEGNFSEDEIPARIGTELQRLLEENTGVKDILKAKKRRSNDIALSLCNRASEIVEDSSDRLRHAVKAALAGNLIDFAVHNADVKQGVLEDALEDPLIIDEIDKAKGLFEKFNNVLYICDNAGEIAFDKILIRELKGIGLKVTACVKPGPIVNDATMEDATYVSLTEACEVIDTGSAAIGTRLDECSQEFLRRFREAEIIISKGQANFETLHDVRDRNIIFILKAKCKPVARFLGVEENSSVVRVNEVQRL